MSDLGIARLWRASASPAGARAYVRYFDQSLQPELAKLDGQRGALVLVSDEGDRASVLVITLWTSMEAIRSFAGEDVSRAVVEPEARALLESFDSLVQHLVVALDTWGG